MMGINEYQPENIEQQVFLADLQIDVIKEEIERQMSSPFSTDKETDFVSTFMDSMNSSYDEINGNMTENYDDEKEQLDMIRDDFFAFLLEMLEEHFNIGVNNLEDMDLDDQEELLLRLYRFTVINPVKEITKYVTRYIKAFKKSLSDTSKKKDVTTAAYKKVVTDPMDLSILANVSECVDIALNSLEDIDVDEFFKKASCSKCPEVDWIDEEYDDCTVTGNFLYPFLEKVKDSYDVIEHIESKIRTKILKKYNE